jgi:hypothetical protein
VSIHFYLSLVLSPNSASDLLPSLVFHLAALEATARWARGGRARRDRRANRRRRPRLHLLATRSASTSTIGSASTSSPPGRPITNTQRIETDVDRRYCSIHPRGTPLSGPPPSGGALHLDDAPPRHNALPDTTLHLCGDGDGSKARCRA